MLGDAKSSLGDLQGLRELNALGYGREGSGLSLDLVYNPGAGFLPPPQATLQEAYKAELHDCYGVRAPLLAPPVLASAWRALQGFCQWSSQGHQRVSQH